jgi:hypothetical protein
MELGKKINTIDSINECVNTVPLTDQKSPQHSEGIRMGKKAQQIFQSKQGNHDCLHIEPAQPSNRQPRLKPVVVSHKPYNPTYQALLLSADRNVGIVSMVVVTALSTISMDTKTFVQNAAELLEGSSKSL